jgi:hypothetical protein
MLRDRRPEGIGDEIKSVSRQLARLRLQAERPRETKLHSVKSEFTPAAIRSADNFCPAIEGPLTRVHSQDLGLQVWRHRLRYVTHGPPVDHHHHRGRIGGMIVLNHQLRHAVELVATGAFAGANLVQMIEIATESTSSLS